MHNGLCIGSTSHVYRTEELNGWYRPGLFPLSGALAKLVPSIPSHCEHLFQLCVSNLTNMRGQVSLLLSLSVSLSHPHSHIHTRAHMHTHKHSHSLTDSLRSALSCEVSVGSSRSLRLLRSFRCGLSCCCSHASLTLFPLSFVLLLVGCMQILACRFGRCVCAQSANTFRSVRWSCYAFQFFNSRLLLCFVLSLSVSLSLSSGVHL